MIVCVTKTPIIEESEAVLPVDLLRLCKTDIALYQKLGKGTLLRMYVDRIIRSSVDLAGNPGALFCPNCQKQLATRVTLKKKIRKHM